MTTTSVCRALVDAHAPTTKPLRLCKRYCNSLVAAGVPCVRCPGCEHAERLFQFWDRVLEAGAR